MAAYHLVTGDG